MIVKLVSCDCTPHICLFWYTSSLVRPVKSRLKSAYIFDKMAQIGQNQPKFCVPYANRYTNSKSTPPPVVWLGKIWAMRDWPIHGALTLWDWSRLEYDVLSVFSTPQERQTRFEQGLIVLKIRETESWSWNFIRISLIYKKDIFLLFFSTFSFLSAHSLLTYFL